MRPDVDVLVVGGRAAGASTAMLLARAGRRVTVVERSPRGTDTVSTHALMRAGVLQLSRWGVLDRLLATGVPAVTTTRFTYPDGEVFDVAIRPGPGVDALHAPRRTVLDPLLLDAAGEAGAEILHRTAVTGLTRAADGRVSGVRAVGPDGRAVTITADLVVGADGVRSRVADDVGARTLRTGRHASSVLYRYVPDLPTRGYEWFYTGGAAVGLIPTNDGETCVFVATTPQRMRELRRAGTDGAFKALLSGAPGGLSDRIRDAGTAGPVRGWAGLRGYVRHSHGPGWALVGDAGQFRDPIGAHGLTDALRDAELLARAVTDDERPSLASYQATRARLSHDLFDVADRVAAFAWTSDQVKGLMRALSAAMVDEVDHLSRLSPVDALA